jgi:hypothetical protein
MKCKGGKVTGNHYCMGGYDKGGKYKIHGAYKDQILSFTWTAHKSDPLESGTVTVRLGADGRLRGHGLYIEPSDGNVHTSIFAAKRMR